MENALETPLQLNENRTFSHLKPRAFTQEDREAIAAKRKEQQTWAEDHLKLHWLDEGWMRDLASDERISTLEDDITNVRETLVLH